MARAPQEQVVISVVGAVPLRGSARPCAGAVNRECSRRRGTGTVATCHRWRCSRSRCCECFQSDIFSSACFVNAFFKWWAEAGRRFLVQQTHGAFRLGLDPHQGVVYHQLDSIWGSATGSNFNPHCVLFHLPTSARGWYPSWIALHHFISNRCIFTPIETAVANYFSTCDLSLRISSRHVTARCC